MVEAPPIDRTITFGPFKLLPNRHLLLRGDTPIRIGSRALGLLIALTDRAGELLTKDELIARVWPNTVVDESNLRAQIALLRKALGDGEGSARHISAVAGRGYRFTAPIASLDDDRTHSLESKDRRSNLPRQLTPPIGREAAINTVKERFARSRLVTIVGPGGIGKTTLGLAVAEQLEASYRDGVGFLDLGPLVDHQLIASVLASTLKLANISEDPLPRVIGFLRDKAMLLVFDSCERVVGAAATLAEALLKEAPNVRILATSREALRAEGESVYQLPSLEAPPVSAGLTAAQALNFPAVQLFVERAASSRNGFELNDSDAPVVADICRQLDGIALAIELAAGRVDAFGTRGIAERLDDRFRFLTGGRRTALPRHQTLGATLDWSYESLSADERAVLRRLAVFVGEFTFEGASAVASDAETANADVTETLANLIAKSLVAVAHGRVARYRLLDTTRAYALAKLSEAGEFHAVMSRLARYLCAALNEALKEIEPSTGPEWLDRHGRHVNDVRTALDWAFSPAGDQSVRIPLTVAAIPLWFQLSSVDECRDGVQRALATIAPGPGRDAHAREVMRLYMALGLSRIFTIGLAPQASVAWAKALEIAENLDDIEEQLQALWGLWFCQIGSGEYRAALQTGQRFFTISESGIDLPNGNRLIGVPLFCLGDIAGSRRHVDRFLASPPPRRAAPESAPRFRFDQVVASRVLLAQLLWLQGCPDQATRAAQEGVEEARVTGHAISLCDALARGPCPIALLTGDLTAAGDSIEALLNHASAHALAQWEVFGRCWKAVLLLKQGDVGAGAELLSHAVDQLQQGSMLVHYSTAFLCALAEGLASAGRVSEALATVERGLDRSRQKEELWYVAELLRVKGEILLRRDAADFAGAERCFLQSIDWARRQGALSWELRATSSLARLLRAGGDVSRARDLLATILKTFHEGFETADLRAAGILLAELS